MTHSELSQLGAADSDSASITPDASGSTPRSSAATLGAKAHRYLALGGVLVFAGGLGFTVSSPSAAQPILVQGAAAGRVALVDTPPRREDVVPDKHSQLLDLIGSWAGDDFEASLDLVYASRSTIEAGDVPA